MNRKTKRISVFLALTLITSGSLYYVFRPSPDSVKKIKSELSISAVELVNAFEENEQEANLLYLDKIITVEGQIIDVSGEAGGKTIVYMEGSQLGNISCSFSEKEITQKELDIGTSVRIKGKCAGYIMDVVLTKCCLVKN